MLYRTFIRHAHLLAMDADSTADESALGISNGGLRKCSVLLVITFAGQRHLFDVLSGRIFADDKPRSRTIRLFVSSNPIGMLQFVFNNFLAGFLAAMFALKLNFCYQSL